MQQPQLERTPSQSTGDQRRQDRSKLNLKELNAHTLFDQFDTNQSGFLEADQFKQLLVYLNDGKPITEEEFQLLMRVSDKNHDAKISKMEVQFAVASWWGYTLLRDKYKDYFDEYSRSGYVDEDSFRQLLTRLNGAKEVPSDEARKVMLKAKAMSSSGQIGEENLMGAVGLWYMAVEREPTPQTDLAMQSVADQIPPEVRTCFKLAAGCVPVVFLTIAVGYFYLHAKFSDAECRAPLASLFLILGFVNLAVALILLPVLSLGLEATFICLRIVIQCFGAFSPCCLFGTTVAGVAMTMQAAGHCDESLYKVAQWVFIYVPLIVVILLCCCCCCMGTNAAAHIAAQQEAESHLQGLSQGYTSQDDRQPLNP